MKYVGEIFKTNKYGNLTVIEYINNRNVHVKFADTGYETITRLDSIKDGIVKDKLSPSVYGVGILGDGVSKTKGKQTKEYQLWFGMLERCFDEKFQKKRPTYKGCKVSDNFKHFPYFKEWCSKQVGFNSKDDKGNPFQLDKDILVKGNKLYSEDACVFVPKEVNILLTKNNAVRGELPIGVSYDKKNRKYVAQISMFKEIIRLGFFYTVEEAFSTYKTAKEAHIKEIANKWKDKIDPRVYEALMNYQVEITD